MKMRGKAQTPVYLRYPFRSLNIAKRGMHYCVPNTVRAPPVLRTLRAGADPAGGRGARAAALHGARRVPRRLQVHLHGRGAHLTGRSSGCPF